MQQLARHIAKLLNGYPPSRLLSTYIYSFTTDYSTQKDGDLIFYIHLSSSLCRRAKALEREFEQIGLKAATQSYTLNTSTDSKSGVNTYAVFYAPRSDGTEALVLSASWTSRDKIINTNAIAMLLSMGKMFKQRSEEALKVRSGAIQAALNLDFSGTGDYNALGIFFEGVNGQLPNLDMINSVADIASSVAPVELTLHDELEPLTENVTKNYINSLKKMLYMMKYQAVGTPTGNHGLYLKYKIDAITLYGFDKPGWHSQRFGLFRIGCLLESSVRSLNNLLEHLHQSFFFYLLSDVRRYTSIGLYMPPVIILGVSFIFHALSLWGLSSDLSLELEAIARNKNAAVGLPYARRARSVKVPATVVGLSFVAGLASFKLLTTQFGFPGETPLLKLVASAGVCSMLVLSAVSSAQVRHRILKMQAADKTKKDAKGIPNNKQDSELAPAPDWITLKTFVLALSALVVTTLSALNFSLAVSIGVVIVWPYLYFRPSRLMLLNIIQTVILAGISPPGLLLFASWQYSMDVSLVLGWILEGYEILGTWLLPTICCIYWPINLAATVMVLLPVS
ncbi:Glycosyl phosphatidyl inositol protein transamidase complex subunit [Podila clonocystis]|nr:Glycosyl phosphatidyl inositol protein transamidase complex subunit [Podila clonocystis]